MPSRLPASAAVVGLAIVAMAALAGCARPARPPPPREPPARVLVVRLERVALRDSAYVELHAWLGAAAREAAAPPSGLEWAAAAYRRAFDEERVEALVPPTIDALASCRDDRCAVRVLAQTPFGRPFAGAFPRFVAGAWTERATIARSAIETIRAAWTPEMDALTLRVAHDLAIRWPSEPVPVDVVVDAPPAADEALLPVVIGAHGACFHPSASSRAADCVLAHAVLRLRTRSDLAVALERELGLEAGARAWSVAAIHAVAATLSAWDRKHVSPTQRSAEAVEGRALAWLAENWRARASDGEGLDAFAARYAASWREIHDEP